MSRIAFLVVILMLAAEMRAASGDSYRGPPTELSAPGRAEKVEPLQTRTSVPVVRTRAGDFSPSLMESWSSQNDLLEQSGSLSIDEAAQQPYLVTTETPQDEWLATAQTWYLGLMHDDARALAGFYDPFGYQFAYGSAGTQPYRLGWYSYNDFVLMTSAPTTAGGNFQDTQWNAFIRYAALLSNSTVLSCTGWMNGKFWSGPQGVNLPAGAAEFMADILWASAYGGEWNWQLGVTPQLNGTFNEKINSNGLMADARAVLLYRASPHWLVAMGAAFWNRVDDRLIPYGGIIWTPNDRWEFRAMFPRSRASYYVGRLRGADTWLYASGEYNVEAYQVDIQGPSVSVRGETSEYRVLIGASATAGIWTMFLEGGLATDRHFRFRGDISDFAMDDCAIVRTGLLF